MSRDRAARSSDPEEWATVPLDLGVSDDEGTHGSIPIALPPRRVLTLPRPTLRAAEKSAHDHWRAAARLEAPFVRLGTPCLVRPTFHEDDLHPPAHLPGTWAVVARGPFSSSWSLTPWSSDALAYAQAEDFATIDAHAWLISAAWRAGR